MAEKSILSTIFDQDDSVNIEDIKKSIKFDDKKVSLSSGIMGI